MGKIEHYRKCVKELLAEFSSHQPASGDIKVEMLLDSERDHYQILHVGWNNEHRVFGVILHIDIEGEKVWIQWNGTEEDIAHELMSMGVEKQDIVIGFHSPFMRQFTEYSMG
jgi:hypothetical protein